MAGPPLATSAPAYDDVARSAYAERRAANPYTVLELIASREGGYASANDTLRRWLRTGVLRPEREPTLYLYEQVEHRGSAPAMQRGLLAAVELEPFGQDVLPHERVEGARLASRLKRLQSVPVDLSPVFALTVNHVPGLQRLLAGPHQGPPAIALTDEQGVDHRIWTVTEPALQDRLGAAFADVPVMIADGHHRYAAALAAGASHTLMYLTEPFEHGPRVRPIHRLVQPVPPDLEDRLASSFTLRPAPDDPEQLVREMASRKGVCFGLVLPGGGSRIVEAGSVQALDVEVLHTMLLPLAGKVTVAYRVDLEAGAEEAATSADRALFVLRAPPLQAILDLARSGRPLPPKTTSFAPKPRTGLVLRMVRDTEARH